MITIKLPPAWDLEFAHALKPGDVYLPESGDPERDDAFWGVVKVVAINEKLTSVWNVDAALDGPPSAVFVFPDGVFVADYGNRRALTDFQEGRL